MDRLRIASLLIFSVLLLASLASGQTATPVSPADRSTPVAGAQTPPTATQGPAPVEPIAANAPHMSKQTRYEIIRDFETQLVYARTAFPMGTKGIKLRNGVTSPNGPELQQDLALYGPAVRPGDPTHISFVQIKEDHIHFDLNGGPVHRKKWYEHITIAGANSEVPLAPNQAPPNPHGTYLDVYFDRYVPEMSAAQLRELLLPVLDFKARSKEEAYLDTVPPKAKEAILAHHVLVGMNTEMVVHARGKAPKKVRERDGEIEYEEWIYGEPPQDVDFVRIVNDEVVRVETMKVGGQKIVRTEKELILERPDKDTEAKQEDRPASAPSLRRPGEDTEDVPKPAGDAAPMPIPPPTPPPGEPGPGDIIAGGN